MLNYAEPDITYVFAYDQGEVLASRWHTKKKQ